MTDATDDLECSPVNYRKSAIIGVILYFSVIGGLTLSSYIVGHEITNIVVILGIFACIVTLIYFRIDLAIRGLLS